jgi:6-phosphogluconolactonase
MAVRRIGAEATSGAEARRRTRGATWRACVAASVVAATGCGGGAGGAGGPVATSPARGAALVAYASGYGPTIDILTVDTSTGALAARAGVASFGHAPSYLATSHAATNLYALDETAPGRVGAYAIEPTRGTLTFLNDVPSGGDGPAHLTVDATDRFVLVANYGDGTVSVLPTRNGGRLADPVQTLQVGAQAHMIVLDPSNRYAFVPCKGADYVAQFVFDAARGTLTPGVVPRLPTAAGAGPRHLAFHPNGRFAYLINELNNTMTAYAFDRSAGTLSAVDTQSTLPQGFSGKDTAAEVWVHPSGAWLLGSNRGDDSIVVFALDPATGRMTRKGHTKTGGAGPRDFAFDPSGTFVYVANQGTGNVVPFRFDALLGTLAPTATPFPVAAATFVGVVALRPAL